MWVGYHACKDILFQATCMDVTCCAMLKHKVLTHTERMPT